jgi:ElaB/YqjD/DUF883 family membrane-anchored ribosome-binding protein
MRHDRNEMRRSDEIIAEIARTRTEIDGTLHAIEHRLTPGQLVDQGLDYLRRSGGNEFMSNLGTSVKHNPLPVALTGIGLAWLMATGKNSGRHDPPPAADSWSARGSETMSSTSDAVASAGQRIGESAQAARERVGETISRASDAVGSAKQRISESAQSARERASQFGQSARNQMKRARSGMDYLVHEQPLALAAVGLAIGAVLAAAAPRTRQEDELMGEARDRLAERAQEVGREQIEKAERVAGAARGAASKEFQQQSASRTSQASDILERTQHYVDENADAGVATASLNDPR